MHYSLTLNKHGTIVLSLQPNTKFLGPGFVIERRKSLDSAKIIKPLQHNYNQHCYFNGHVVNASSRVAVSTCNGLVSKYPLIYYWGQKSVSEI